MRTSTIRRMIGRLCVSACLWIALALMAALDSAMMMSALMLDPALVGHLGSSAVPLYQWLEARLLPPAH